MQRRIRLIQDIANVTMLLHLLGLMNMYDVKFNRRDLWEDYINRVYGPVKDDFVEF